MKKLGEYPLMPSKTKFEMPETIFQCGKCLRFFAEGNVISISIGQGLALSKRGGIELFECGREDCAAACERNLARDKQKRLDRINRRQVTAAQRGGHRPAATVNPRDFRSSCPPEKDFDAPVVAHHPSALEHEFQASGAADSANKVLLEFFRRRENFNLPFLSSDLEKYTESMGHKSTRMNNRAIWLREQVLADGLYLDNDPTGRRWGLPSGSYYKLCRIEDATSLGAEQKLKMTKMV